MYSGPERRKHKVFVTRQSEYHLKDNQVLVVRHRRTGIWLRSHEAVKGSLCGSIRFSAEALVPNTGRPREGESLCFQNGRDLEIITSPLLAVRRATKEEAELYPARH